jgi:hypothetical protein
MIETIHTGWVLLLIMLIMAGYVVTPIASWQVWSKLKEYQGRDQMKRWGITDTQDTDDANL